MKLIWLEALCAVARTGDLKIAAIKVKRSPNYIQRTILRAEERLGHIFFHRLPWLNKGQNRQWQIADDKARLALRHIGAMLDIIGDVEQMATSFGTVLGLREPMRIEWIERVVAVEGNSIVGTARAKNINKNRIYLALERTEEWLGLKIYEDMDEDGKKYKMPSVAGKMILPELKRVVGHWGEMNELIRRENGK